VQDAIRWIPPVGPLGRLTAAAHRRAAALLPSLAALRDEARDLAPPPSFSAALRSGATIAVIAEVKRRSPSKGTINANLHAADRAALYESHGARALSVLTEPEEFGGSGDDLREIHQRVDLPLLKKDFHVHEAQVWEARVLGASAFLLIARALDPLHLERLAEACREAALEPLVEVRSEGELAVALESGATLIGVNARDLETLVIEPRVTERLLPAIPDSRIRIAESGMSATADVERVARLGADAVLIGSSLSAAADPAGLLRELSGVRRTAGPAASAGQG